jgi:glycosyltransferase 2 family protein
MLAFFSRARRWILMIRPLGYNPSLLNTYHSLMTGYLVNFAFPRLGEVSRCMALGKKENIPVDKLIGTVIVERTFDVLSMLLIMALMLILKSGLTGSFIGSNVVQPLTHKFYSLFDMSLTVSVILALSILILIVLVIIFRKKLIHNRIISKIASFLKGIGKGLKSFYSMANKPEFIFHTIFIWVNYILMAWVVLFTIPATANLGFSDAIFILVIGSLGMSAPVQGGIGAFHWIISRGLHFVYGISIEDGLVYATISHESQLILIAVLGAFSFYRLFSARSSSPGKKSEILKPYN